MKVQPILVMMFQFEWAYGETAAAIDLRSISRKGVGVQVPLCLPDLFPLFLPQYVGVSEWQLGHSKRRLLISLLVLSPSM